MRSVGDELGDDPVPVGDRAVDLDPNVGERGREARRELAKAAVASQVVDGTTVDDAGSAKEGPPDHQIVLMTRAHAAAHC